MPDRPDVERAHPARSVVLGFAAAVAAFCAATADARAADCNGLASFPLSGAAVTSAVEVPAGGLTVATGLTLPGLPAFCRVVGVIRPTSDSDIRFEVWLPSSGWNGRYQQVGNGGLAGSIVYGAMGAPLQRGYAVASTDNGHQSNSLDGSWALGHPEKVADFGYRAVHLTSEVAKILVTAFYGRSARYSYFTACSEGGREAHMEAQRYPEDFNGILVGAPANNWTDLMVRFVWNQRALLDKAASYIPASKLPAVQAASLAACDTRDSSADGVVADPSRCRWDPVALLCPEGADTDSCLTRPQVEALRAIYAGPSNPRTGRRISTGYERTGENSENWKSYIIGSERGNALQLQFSTEFYRGFVFEDPNWDVRSFDFDRDVAFARRKLGHVLDATSPDMRAFRQAGGKMIQYHGWLDASPQPRSSIEYYNSVVANEAPFNHRSSLESVMGLRQTRTFYRLFMVPGMEHCVGGPGPNAFGQPLAAPPPSNDPRHDVLSALENWVERGLPPDELVATKYVNDDPAAGIRTQGLLCPYPEEARWTGQGSANEAQNYFCHERRR